MKIIQEKLADKSNWLTETKQIQAAFPNNWIKILVKNESNNTLINTNLIDKRNKSYKNSLAKISSKDFYIDLINHNEKPTGFLKWNSTLPGKDVLIELPKYTNYIFEHLLQNKFKAYKWNLIHFILPCGKLIHTWNILSSDKCNYCNEIDDYDHLFIKYKFLIIKSFGMKYVCVKKFISILV